MAVNKYFTQGTQNEQRLYQDLIIESLKVYGQDVYYIPREIVNRDNIFGDDNTSRFDNAYRVEMYIENTEGFDGEGDLFSKFGIEIRDAATFIVARRRWQQTVGQYENTIDEQFYRPREGDLIYLTLSNTMFEITRVETESPFYQLKDLPVFKMRCEMFEYNDEDFDTGVATIDAVETIHAYQNVLVFNQADITGTFEIDEAIRQTNSTYTMNGEITSIDASDPDNYKVYVTHSGASDGEYHTWTTTNPIVGVSSGATGTPSSTDDEDLQEGAQNDFFDTEADDFLDFSESNPFGDPQ